MGEVRRDEEERLLPPEPDPERDPLAAARDAGAALAVVAFVVLALVVVDRTVLALAATVLAVTVTGAAAAAGAGVAAGFAAAGAAGIAVTGVVAAGLALVALPAAEVEVARGLGVAMTVVGSARGEVAEGKRRGPDPRSGGEGALLNRRATSGR
jgi:hypothetical protein